jgi:uncharacterized protein (TIGR02246 family)
MPASCVRPAWLRIDHSRSAGARDTRPRPARSGLDGSRRAWLPVAGVALAALLLAPPLGAQTGGAPAAGAEPPAAGGEAAAAAAEAAPTVDQLHDELRAVRAAMETALNRRDVEGLLAHVTPDVVFTTMNGDVARGAQGIRDYFARMMEGEGRIVETVTTHFEPDDLSILYGDSVAIAFGRSDDHYELTNGRVFDVAARWTATLLRQDGEWKIAAFHYSTNMFDNPVLAAQRKALIGGAVAAAAAAFAVAFVLGRALGRRRAAAEGAR